MPLGIPPTPEAIQTQNTTLPTGTITGIRSAGTVLNKGCLAENVYYHLNCAIQIIAICCVVQEEVFAKQNTSKMSISYGIFQFVKTAETLRNGVFDDINAVCDTSVELRQSLNDILSSYTPAATRFSMKKPIFSKSWSICLFSISTCAVKPSRPLRLARYVT